jgi:hypothetical protein
MVIPAQAAIQKWAVQDGNQLFYRPSHNHAASAPTRQQPLSQNLNPKQLFIWITKHWNPWLPRNPHCAEGQNDGVCSCPYTLSLRYCHQGSEQKTGTTQDPVLPPGLCQQTILIGAQGSKPQPRLDPTFFLLHPNRWEVRLLPYWPE